MNREQSIRTAPQRFWSNVAIGGHDDCWTWTAGRTSRKLKFQYGTFNVGGKTIKAHRVSYALANKVPVPPSHLFVLHRCDNPICVNPNHLSLGTNDDNVQDMVRKGRARGAVGTRNAGAKITEQQVREIRASTEILRVLAQRYKIKKSMISNIRRGHSWKHVT